ncbi:hypothetical protein NIES4071_42580 [Calothrix sp. NIES-4071]|nr:hypothetical protein NIES4071_42580 [Calothrix sp. NIES-4071]BAZ58571.1 hypothetical protein NIES4105_42500 [Calothrix sp. NIES-4105]
MNHKDTKDTKEEEEVGRENIYWSMLLILAGAAPTLLLCSLHVETRLIASLRVLW